jgi:hypothetical protein
VEELGRGQLPVEDVAADEAVLVLHLVRPITCRCRIVSVNPWRDRLDPGDDAVGVRLELGGVRCL